MKPKKQQKSQLNLFQSRLDQILNMDHPLVKLSQDFAWEDLEKRFGAFFSDTTGRPALPTRLVVGLHYLKYAFNESDESVVARFIENPYWQYFCGCDYFQHEFPIDPSSLSRWRRRIGEGGAEELLKKTIEVAQKKKLINKTEMKRVNVDTTVQEKAIAFPTDSALYHKARKMLVKEAKERGIVLRQSYERVGAKAYKKQGRYRHARQMKRARREVRFLRTYLGRVIRDIERKCAKPDEQLQSLLELAKRIYSQKKFDKKKLYSLHAPEVECIAKGKSHKKYEFGCKVSIVSTSKNNWVVGVKAFHGNPYDGHTLKAALDQAHELVGIHCESAFVDRGYRGCTKVIPEIKVYLAGGSRKLKRSLKKWFKRRSAIEPIIGHLKSDNRMNRNHLKGKLGDSLNALFAGCGFNFRKLLREFRRFIFFLLFLVDQNTPKVGLAKKN